MTAILGIGARIATGLDALTTAMSLRAGKSFVRESRFVDRAGEPIALATVSTVGDERLGRARYVELAAPALVEALRERERLAAARGQKPRPVPLLLAVPSEPDDTDVRGTKLLAALAERSGAAIDLARSRAVALGRAGGASAIEQAVERLARGEDEAIVVGGVDSYFDPDRLEALDRDRRLHGPSAENGFVPGEGAAFLLLAARGGELTPYASVLGAGTEREPRPWGSEEPCHALGLTIATKKALAGARGQKIGWAITDVVGERHRVEEWLFALGRTQGAFASELVHDQPLLLAGDLGAASVPVLAAVACAYFRAGCAPDALALLAAASDDAERGAVLIGAAS